VQHHYAGLGERSGVNLLVEHIVRDVIETDIRTRRRKLDGSKRPQSCQQRGGVVGDSCPSRRQRRMESDLHTVRVSSM
jgi:hypothetical protein